MMVPELVGYLIHQCSKTKALRQGLPLHAIAIKTAAKSDVIVSNHILNLYAKCRKLGEARQVFDEMSERNLVSWSAMISGYEQIGEPNLALGLFSKLNAVPNEYVYASVISACASLKGLVQGKQIHGQALKFGLDSVSFVSNALITMYMKCGKCSDALLAYNEALELDPVAYNALITGFVENQQPDKGFEVFRMMYQEGFFPDRFTFVGLLGTCNGGDDMKRGELLHCQTIKLKLDSSAFIGNLIITMYSKLNLLEEAEKAFRSIEEKDIISWNTFLSSCSHCNDHEKALQVFKEMLNECRVRPDEFTFASALAACSGLASMCNGKQIHGHLIRTRLYQDVGSLLSACRLHGDVDTGKRFARQLLKLQPVTTSPYVLLSNLYASDEMWDGVVEAWKLLKGSGLKKEPGHSLIEVKGTFEKFTVVDFSHSRTEEIMDILKTLSWEAIEV
ncbi:hypothetical protein OIU78_003340 [Salix suchowensis]|nr:hypothetical protein OIU78_003340 [Salix suchowensis]